MRRLALAAVLLGALAPTLARAQPDQGPRDAPMLLLLPILTEGRPVLPDARLLRLRRDLAERVERGGRHRVVSETTLQQAIAERRGSTDLQCRTLECMLALGRQLSAQTVLTIALSRHGDECFLTVRRLDARTHTVQHRAVHRSRCAETALVAVLDAVGVELGAAATGGPAR